MDKEIQDADDKYEQQIAAIPKDYTEEQRQARMISLKNGVASKKSQIRKSYGVTLRMRERDKQARKSAGMSTPPANPRLEEYRAQPPPRPNSGGPVNETPTSTPPVSGFSPINGNKNNTPTPPTAPNNHGSGSPNPQAPWGSDISLGQYKSQYRPPPINAAQRVQNSFTIPHPNTLTHALESQPAPGYGVLRPNNPPQQLTPSNYQQVTSNKRRRTSEDVGGAEPRGVTHGEKEQGGLAMLPVRVEDAASKFPRKNPLLQGQRREDGRGVSGGDVPMSEAGSSAAIPAPAPAPVRRGSKEAAITIISSSSESEGERNEKRGGGEGAGSANGWVGVWGCGLGMDYVIMLLYNELMQALNFELFWLDVCLCDYWVVAFNVDINSWTRKITKTLQCRAARFSIYKVISKLRRNWIFKATGRISSL
jgi:hypothetical protein